MENTSTNNQNSLSNICFYRDEVCETTETREVRLRKLKRATIIGNGQRKEARLVFKKEDGDIFELVSKVWCVSEKNVTLMAGITIPLCSILSVELL